MHQVIPGASPNVSTPAYFGRKAASAVAPQAARFGCASDQVRFGNDSQPAGGAEAPKERGFFRKALHYLGLPLTWPVGKLWAGVKFVCNKIVGLFRRGE